MGAGDEDTVEINVDKEDNVEQRNEVNIQRNFATGNFNGNLSIHLKSKNKDVDELMKIAEDHLAKEFRKLPKEIADLQEKVPKTDKGSAFG